VPPIEHSETIRRFAYEGPLSLAQLALLGLAAAALTGFLIWRDTRSLNSTPRFLFLLCARLIALGIILWMLAGPSMDTISRETKPKSIVILADASGSMGLVDPVDGSGGSARWGEAQAKPVGPIEARQLDGAIGTLESARANLLHLRQAGQDAAREAEWNRLWKQLQESVKSAATQLDAVAARWPGRDEEVKTGLARAADFLRQGMGGANSGAAMTGGRRERDSKLDETGDFIEAGLQRVERLAQKAAVRAEQTPASSGQASGLAGLSAITRKEKIASWLDGAEASWLKELETKARVLRYTFDAKSSPVAERNWSKALADQAGESSGATDLSAALGQAAQDAAKQPVDAVVMVTDGGHNYGRDPRDEASGLRGTPLYLVPIGTTEMPRDVIVHHAHAPRAVFKEDTVVVDAMTTAYSCEGEQLKVELLADGIVAETKTQAISSKVFDGRVTFRWKASELGRHKLKVRAEPLARERSIDNNESPVEVEVMEDTIRVLIADNFPRWEFRYLVNLFKRDKHVEFEQTLFEPNDSTDAGPPQAFPADLEAWRRYRVVIIGDVTPAELPRERQEMLRKYVADEGGNVIFIAGDAAMPGAFAGQPLEELIPTAASTANNGSGEGMGLVVTAEGSVSIATQLDDDPLTSERIWREMSAKLPVYNLSKISKPKPTSHVLIAAAPIRGAAPNLAGEQNAFLSWQYVGAGRVIYIAAPITYQLRYRNGDGHHHRFWGQLLRWAIARDLSSGSKTVRLATDKNRYEQGEQSQIVLRLTQADGRVVSGGTANVEARQGGQLLKMVEMREDATAPGAYRGDFNGLPPGNITLRAAGATVDMLLRQEGRREPVEQIINVDPRGTAELANPLCNLPLLGQIADASGGAVVPPVAIENALAGMDLTPKSEEKLLSRQPMWDRWSLLWVFFLCVTMEWLARKKWGML
jgi:hypothetical protein